MTLFPKILEELRKRQLDHVLLTGGGIMPPEDVRELREMGVGELFRAGNADGGFVASIRAEVARRRAAARETSA